MDEKKLESAMDKKMEKLCKKYPRWCLGFISEMNEALDWYEKKKSALTSKGDTR